MNDDEKTFARASVLSVLEIRNRDIPTMLEPQREQLIIAMKTAVLQGAHAASLVATGAVLLCAVVVAILVPWAPAEDRGTMLAWHRAEDGREP